MYFKRLALNALKITGGFNLARSLTAKDLRILCYHGVSLLDEHEFLPKLFISPDVFQSRMEKLSSSSMSVLSLEQALQLLDQSSLPPNSVVLTIDDGWYGISKYAVDVLDELNLPSTLYSTTYYSCKGTMVFNVALRYMFEKRAHVPLQLGSLDIGLSGTVSLMTSAARGGICEKIQKMATAIPSAEERETLLFRIALSLGLDSDEIREGRLFTLMTPTELKDARGRGMDIQLHTHRHRELDGRADQLITEISDNRFLLESLFDETQKHFCYPSGVTDARMLSVLRDLEIISAVTCEPGFNRKNTNKLLLKRFLDGANISRLEFDAEINGVLELGRKFRSKLKS